MTLRLPGLGERDLWRLTDDLIDAYVAAVEWVDAEMRRTLRAALFIVGRYLAARVGPRATSLHIQ